jgi:hypothetical protein
MEVGLHRWEISESRAAAISTGAQPHATTLTAAYYLI